MNKFVGLLAGAALAATAGQAMAQTDLKFALDWKFEGPAAPFLVAIDKGHFSAEGLDVSVEPGNGSVEPVARVASGNYDIGFGDINTLIRFRDQNPANPMTAVFMVYNKAPFSIVTRKSRGINDPKDLEGKKLGAPAGDGRAARVAGSGPRSGDRCRAGRAVCRRRGAGDRARSRDP